MLFYCIVMFTIFLLLIVIISNKIVYKISKLFFFWGKMLFPMALKLKYDEIGKGAPNGRTQYINIYSNLNLSGTFLNVLWYVFQRIRCAMIPYYS